MGPVMEGAGAFPAASKSGTREWPAFFSIKAFSFVFGLAAMISISAAYVVWGILLLILIHAIVWKRASVSWKSLPFLSLFAAYVLWGFAASVTGLDTAKSLYQWRSDWLCLFFWSLYLFFLIYPESQRALTRGFWAAIILMGSMGIFQFIMIHHFPALNEWLAESSLSILRRLAVLPRHHMRVHAHLHILTYAEIMVIAGLFALGQPWRRAWHKAAIAMLCLACVLASQSRGASIAFFAGAAVFFGISFWWHRRIAWKILIPLFFIGAMILSLPFVSGRLIGSINLKDNRDRLVMWRVGARIVKDNPVTGVGLGHVKTIWNKYCEEEWRHYLADGREVWSDVHSLYIQQASERGIPGLLIVVLLLGAFPLVLLKKMRKLPHPTLAPGGEIHRRREQLLAACAAGAAFLVMNLTESAFQDTEVVFALYLVLACALASEKRLESAPSA